MLVSTGAGLLTVNVSAEDTPPPGAGVADGDGDGAGGSEVGGPSVGRSARSLRCSSACALRR